MASVSLLEPQISLIKELFKTASSDSAGGSEEAKNMLGMLASCKLYQIEALAQKQIKTCLRDLEVKLSQCIDENEPSPEEFNDRDTNSIYYDQELQTELQAIFRVAVWIFSMPEFGCEFGTICREGVLDLLLTYKNLCHKEAYSQLYLLVFSPVVYLPLLQESVKIGLKGDLTFKLLSLWAFVELDDRMGSSVFEEVQSNFVSILSTLSPLQQKEILNPWLPALLRPKDGSSWDAWLKKWMDDFLFNEGRDAQASVLDLKIPLVNCQRPWQAILPFWFLEVLPLNNGQ